MSLDLLQLNQNNENWKDPNYDDEEEEQVKKIISNNEKYYHII